MAMPDHVGGVVPAALSHVAQSENSPSKPLGGSGSASHMFMNTPLGLVGRLARSFSSFGMASLQAVSSRSTRTSVSNFTVSILSPTLAHESTNVLIGICRSVRSRSYCLRDVRYELNFAPSVGLPTTAAATALASA